MNQEQGNKKFKYKVETKKPDFSQINMFLYRLLRQRQDKIRIV